MWNWTKEKLGYRKNIKKLKGKYIDGEFYNNPSYIESRFPILFDQQKLNPVIDNDKRYFGSKNIPRMLLRAYQRYNYYCSENSIYIDAYNFNKKENGFNRVYNEYHRQLCNEDNKNIDKYHGYVSFIKFNNELDIYEFDESIENNESELLRIQQEYVPKFFTMAEWGNILTYFMKIKYATKMALASRMNLEQSKLIIKSKEDEKFDEIKKYIEDNEYKDNNIHGDEDEDDEDDEIESRLKLDFGPVFNYDEVLPSNGGDIEMFNRKNKRKTNKRKTNKSKTNKRKTKRRRPNK
jgi:hypothetical protein